jgi:hypothetical protein
MNLAAKRIAVVLAVSLQICSAASEGGAAARPAKHRAAGAGVVPTVEVLREVRSARQNKEHYHPGYGYYPLEKITDYPIMTISVDPAEPADFVVMINKTSYKAGMRQFRVVTGSTSIIVTRRGKEPCKATLEVTETGPNTIACRL